MLKLEDIQTGALVEGLVPGRAVTVMASIWHGDHDLEVIYQDPEKRLDRSLLSRADEGRLAIAAAEDSWPLDGDGRLFKLASEARRMGYLPSLEVVPGWSGAGTTHDRMGAGVLVWVYIAVLLGVMALGVGSIIKRGAASERTDRQQPGERRPLRS